jgi:oligopeptide transport system ATP-binding protein
VETVDVSALEPDPRYASTDVIDQDAFTDDGGRLPASRSSCSST